MSENNKLLLYVAVIIFSFLGLVIGTIAKDIADDLLGASGLIATSLLWALLWIVLALVTYYGIGWAASVGEKTGMTSITFILFWIMSAVGLVVGTIVLIVLGYGSAIISLDAIVTDFFLNLQYALIPALASALSLSNKTR
ncbi:MAG: hypothetical protein ACXAEU_17715 [Candidatus Hodarchaeales archaeon]